ncbi:hypothetical protein NL676_030714 [Syzygium grande]|nr:hypothetical protein NL676_030714 [Syzygium grande]
MVVDAARPTEVTPDATGRNRVSSLAEPPRFPRFTQSPPIRYRRFRCIPPMSPGRPVPTYAETPPLAVGADRVSG